MTPPRTLRDRLGEAFRESRLGRSPDVVTWDNLPESTRENWREIADKEMPSTRALAAAGLRIVEEEGR